MNDSAASTETGEGEPVALPATRGGIRNEVSDQRWRLLQTVESVLADVAEHVDWEKIYDGDAPLQDYIAWGLFMEEVVPAATQRIRDVFAEPLGLIDRVEGNPEELEDHLFWGTKQIESGMQQTLSILSRQLVNILTGSAEETRILELLEERERERRRELCAVLAEAAGKFRSDLRRFAAFVVAGETFDSSQVEVILFPRKTEELEKSQRLKEGLVAIMEGFQGSERRLSIADVLRRWRDGDVFGSAALAEIDALIGSLGSMLETENRKALYVDSYFRLSDWNAHLSGCSKSLRQHLGNDLVEDTLTKEIAAILDTDMLAEILGKETVATAELPGDLPELLRLMTKRQVSKLKLSKGKEDRLQELRAAVVGKGASPPASPPDLEEGDEELVLAAAAIIQGRRLVDQLRIRVALPESLTHLEHVHSLVLSSEEGLKTYLMLLYGQIHNRDFHQLKSAQRTVSIAEKRLAVLEMEYQVNRLASTRRYEAFEAVRGRVAKGEAIEPEEWQGLSRFLDHLTRELAPRIGRISTYVEVEGITPDEEQKLLAACNELQAFDETYEPDRYDIMRGHLDILVEVLGSLKDLRMGIAPPETVAEIEEYLNMMG
jgi:hypothetical protein